MSHTKEPWYIEIDDENDFSIVNRECLDGQFWDICTVHLSKENADRIVACVNALAGLEDPEKAMKALIMIAKQVSVYLTYFPDNLCMQELHEKLESALQPFLEREKNG